MVEFPSDAPYVDIAVVREFPHPVEQCFAWLTDYSEDDPTLAGVVLRKRRVLERHEDRVVIEARNEIMGAGMKGRAEVRLFPKEWRYEARTLEGDGGAILYTYQLTPLGPSRTRLEVHYHTRVRKFWRRAQVRLAAPLVKRELHKMWDGFTAAMARDLGDRRG